MSAYQRSHEDWAKENIVLCSELKHLYVGVTRARSRLWILESNTSILGSVQRLFNQTATSLLPRQYPGPILDILEEQHIEVSQLHKRLSTGRTISASQWREMGYQMIDDRKYSKALRCFQDVEDPNGIALANAYITEQNGLTNRALEEFELANLDFIKASEFFLEAHSIAKAVQCRKEGGDPKGAVKILADNGAYEDAAWLSADVGLFLQTSEIYTKLNKYERALAGYARGKQFKRMFNYLRKFESEIEPCCWKQYALLGYLGEFGKSDVTPDDFEKRALCLFGSLKEQEVVLLRFGLVKKLFELLSTDQKYMEAYEIGASFGLTADSIQLLNEKLLLKDLKLEQEAQLNKVCEFLQAEHIASNPWLRTGGDGGIHEVLWEAVGRGSPKIDSFVETWKGINRAFDIAARRRTGLDIREIGQIRIASYVDILVTRSAYPNNEFPPPFECIERVLKDLRIVSLHETIPYSTQLYCGIYEMPRQLGKYTLLDWSPLHASSTTRLPLRPVGIGSLRRKILRHILGDIVPPFDEAMRVIWGKKAELQPPPSVTLAETHLENLDWVARLCQIFSEFSTMVKGNRKAKDSFPGNWDWRFWRGVFLEHMEFRSSYEQSLDALCGIRSELMTRDGVYRASYPHLIKDDTTQYRVESAIRMGTGACLSSLLAQYQTSLFLGYKDQWRSTLLELRNQTMARGNQNLKYGCAMITLVNRYMSETEAGDFPGRFCENIYSILDIMRREKSSLNFYSASVVSLYEELTFSLIFLVRPYEFLIPDSWHRLYFRGWERKYRSPSILERFLYQQCLARVCLSFCEIVINIEGKPTKEFALARRSVTLIVVCLINLGTFFPRPAGYAELWRKSQEVFDCAGLDARGIVKLREDKLIGRLTKVFQEYRGRDSIHLVWGHQGRVDSFAGIPLKGNGISVVASNPVRQQWKPGQTQDTRKLNAAYILTAFWKLNGRKLLEKIQGRRRYFAGQYKYPKNC